MTQCLHHLEHDGIAQRPVSCVEITSAHDPFGELSCSQLTVFEQMPGTQIGNFALSKEAVTDNVACPLLLDVGK